MSGATSARRSGHTWFARRGFGIWEAGLCSAALKGIGPGPTRGIHDELAGHTPDSASSHDTANDATFVGMLPTVSVDGCAESIGGVVDSGTTT